MKKNILTLALVATLITGLTLSMQTNSLAASGGFEIDENEFGSWLLGYNGPGGDVVIPDGVTWISCGFENHTDITSVTIPGSVETIGSAFTGCTGLTDVTIGDGVTKIEMEAFSGCTSLEHVSIPGSVKEIRQFAFKGTPWLASLGEFARVNDILILYQGAGGDVVVPDGITTIAESAFSGMPSVNNHITSIKLPGSVTAIQDSAFYYCYDLTDIEIPYGVTQIGNNAFGLCTSLTGITLPDSLTSLGHNAFIECPNLTRVKIPGSVTFIGNDLFYRSPYAVIYGSAGSTAESYAHENRIPFAVE